MNKPRLHPDAPRIVLRRLVKAADMKQKDVAAAVGEREDTFSKILSGAEGYDLRTPLLVTVLATIDVDFVDFAEAVEKESTRLHATSTTVS
jgi:transcriptional regulator with XRE-family HTH domain